MHLNILTHSHILAYFQHVYVRLVIHFPIALFYLNIDSCFIYLDLFMYQEKYVKFTIKENVLFLCTRYVYVICITFDI